MDAYQEQDVPAGVQSRELLERYLLQSKEFGVLLPPQRFSKIMQSVFTKAQLSKLPQEVHDAIYDLLMGQKDRHFDEVKEELEDLELAADNDNEEGIHMQLEPLKVLTGQMANLNRSLELECNEFESQVDLELEEIKRLVQTLEGYDLDTSDLNADVEAVQVKLIDIEAKLFSEK